MDAEWVQVGWTERMEKERADKEWADKEQAAALAAKLKMVEPEDAASKRVPPAMQESAIDVDEVEDVVAPVAE